MKSLLESSGLKQESYLLDKVTHSRKPGPCRRQLRALGSSSRNTHELTWDSDVVLGAVGVDGSHGSGRCVKGEAEGHSGADLVLDETVAGSSTDASGRRTDQGARSVGSSESSEKVGFHV